MERNCGNCKHGELLSCEEPCVSCLDQLVPTHRQWQPRKHERVKAPMRPHKEQDGWRYVRARFGGGTASESPIVAAGGIVEYDDAVPGSRIISSRRVEDAVETADYINLCAEEGLVASYDGTADEWIVFSHDAAVVWRDHGTPVAVVSNPSNTIREAYWRYKAGAK